MTPTKEAWAAPARTGRGAARPLDVPGLAVFVVTLAVVLYLGVSDGGYDLLVWGEIGLLFWWVVFLGALIGVLPVAGAGRLAANSLLLLAALALWSGLGISWSESSERAVAELARLATYLGAFVLAIAAAHAGHARRLLEGLIAAIVAIAGIALLSRLHPAWFSPEAGSELLAERNRLDYPLNYFNALGALLAGGLVLLASAVSSARTEVGRALAGCAIPIVALTLYFTQSRGGALALVVGGVVLIATVPKRLLVLASLAPAVLGSAILVAVAEEQPALTAGLRDAAAQTQGYRVLALIAVVTVCVAIGQIVVQRALQRAQWPSRLGVRPGGQLAVASMGLAALMLAFLALGGTDEVSDGWHEFKDASPGVEQTGEKQGLSRLTSVTSRGRYQIWRSAVDAVETAPLQGIGPGGFEFWWTRHGRLDGFFRDGHSLYFDSLAELGIIGLLLVLGFIGFVLVAGAARAFKEPGIRDLAAPALAGCAVFAVSALLEWVWEVTVLGVAFMVLAAIAVAARPGGLPTRRPARAQRIGLAAIAVVGIAVIAPPLVSTAQVRSSERAAGASDLDSALEHARTAERLQPYAASPKIQHALVLERSGRLAAAARRARAATEAESTNWRQWTILSRIEAARGRADAARHAYGRARELNPRSRLFKAADNVNR